MFWVWDKLNAVLVWTKLGGFFINFTNCIIYLNDIGLRYTGIRAKCP